jgi:hypothetical protein
MNLKLDNFFDIKEDYIMTGSLVKVKESNSFMIFAPDGQFEGIS